MSVGESLTSTAQGVPMPHAKRKRSWWVKVTGLALFLVAFAMVWITNVPTHLTTEDVLVMEDQLELKDLQRPVTFEDEIRVVKLIQERVFAKAPFGTPIPEYELREPSDLMRYGRGWCYDRSRTLEKALTYMGFEVRHVFCSTGQNFRY